MSAEEKDDARTNKKKHSLGISATAVDNYEDKELVLLSAGGTSLLNAFGCLIN